MGVLLLQSAEVSASNWPVQVGDPFAKGRPGTIISSPNGNIYLCHYEYKEREALVLGSQGETVLDLDHNFPILNFCGGTQIRKTRHNTSTNGTIYASERSRSQPTQITAYSGSQRLWTSIVSQCSNDKIGDIFVHEDKIFTAFESCGQSMLGWFDQKAGARLGLIQLSSSTDHIEDITAYKDGLIQKSEWPNIKFTYHPFDDPSNTTTITPTIPIGENLNDWHVDVDGRIMAVLWHNSVFCDGYITSRVQEYTTAGLQRETNFTQDCLKSRFIHAKPDGYVMSATRPNSTTEGYLISMQDSAVKITPTHKHEGRTYELKTVGVDIAGNTLLTREYEVREGLRNYRHSELFLYDANSNLLKHFSTETLKKDRNHTFSGASFVSGRVYLLLEYDGHHMLHNIPLELIGNEYIQSELLELEAAPTQPLKYIAMGDSFSSGEGVEPFIEGTADEGLNECHRSEFAYSKLLSADTSLPLVMPDDQFLACSGAVTENITSISQYGNEPPQIDRLDRDTDLVTLTIGGNDVGFATYARNCVLSSCEEGTDHYDTIMNKINNELYGKLVNTYEQISDELDKEDARVVISGYPYVFPH